MSPRTLCKWLVMAVLGTGAAILILFILAIAWPRPAVVEGTDRPEWLPAAASGVFHRSQSGFGWWKAAEFTISESDLRAWTEKCGWSLQERRAVALPTRLLLRRAGKTSDSPEEFQVIPRALVYERRAPNGGGVTLVFDPAVSRAYVVENHR